MSQYTDKLFRQKTYAELADEVSAHLATLNLPQDERASTYWLRREAIEDYLNARLREQSTTGRNSVTPYFVTLVMKAI